MEFIQPKVYLVAETRIVEDGLNAYLQDIMEGVDGEATLGIGAQSDAEILSEVAGRLCYNSFYPGLNANVTRITDTNTKYLANIIKQKHGNVMEHVSVTFIFRNVSRVFTHELVRHRAGTSISQESLRYVRLTDLKAYFPDAFAQVDMDGSLKEKFKRVFDFLEHVQVTLANHLQLDEAGVSFHKKKLLTSAMRRLAPMGLATNIMWTCNMRALRHVIEQRTSPHAEEEIRAVFDQVAYIASVRYPNIFSDFERETDGSWIPTTSKI